MAQVLKSENNMVIDASHSEYPSQLQVVKASVFASHPVHDKSFYYGFVVSETCSVKNENFSATLSPGMYFSLNSGFELNAHGTVVLFKRLNYTGLNSTGGPVEPIGRQKYIDGCTSTLLLAPAHLGDSCFNYLYFPPNTIQSKHFHPSLRFGVVTGGNGFCHTSNDKIKLEKGDCFYLEENEEHYFSSQQDALSVVAYHPDSDWGPTHEAHPMLNRTILKK